MNTFVEVGLKVDGLHRWVDAPDAVSFLRESHRHIIEIKAGVHVIGLDREIEFYMFKAEIIKALDNLYPKVYTGIYDFGGRSCERIALDLIEAMGLDYCSVSEDGENRAIVGNWSYP